MMFAIDIINLKQFYEFFKFLQVWQQIPQVNRRGQLLRRVGRVRIHPHQPRQAQNIAVQNFLGTRILPLPK